MTAWIIDLTDNYVIAEIEGSENYIMDQAISLLKNIDNSALTFEKDLTIGIGLNNEKYIITTDTNIIQEN